MKNLILTLIVSSVTMTTLAQKMPRIKGDKEVVSIEHTLDPFYAIEVQNDLEVDLIQGETHGYQLSIDKNLVDIVKLVVSEDVLKIYTINKITSAKKVEIKVNMVDINKLSLRDNASVTSINKLELHRLECSLTDDAQINLDIIVDKSEFYGTKDAKFNLKLKGKNVKFDLDDNAMAKGSVVASDAAFNLKQRANAKFTGDVNDIEILATGKTSVNFKDLIAKNADVNSADSADIYVYANYQLRLYAQGSSYIYVYGNPELKVDGLNDKSQIIKK